MKPNDLHNTVRLLGIVGILVTSLLGGCARTGVLSGQKIVVPSVPERFVMIRTGSDDVTVIFVTNGVTAAEILFRADRLSLHCSTGPSGNDLNVFIRTNGIAIIRNHLDDKTSSMILDKNGDLLPELEVITDRRTKETRRYAVICTKTNVTIAVSPGSTLHNSQKSEPRTQQPE